VIQKTTVGVRTTSIA